MTDWERIANHFNATAKCRRLKDVKPQVKHEPGCTEISCQHDKCACVMLCHADRPLSAFLAEWTARHG